MGTNTPILGLYKPADAEVGWGDEVDANFDVLESRITSKRADIRDYGAVGDNVTDDSGPIQTALDSGRHVYIPPLAGTAAYKIGTPLSPKSGQIVWSDGGTGGYGAAGARLEATGANAKIFQFGNISETRLVNLMLQDRNYVSTGGTTNPVDTGIYAPSRCSAIFLENIHFIGLSYAIHAFDWLVNHCHMCFFFNSPSRYDISVNGDFNDNHWSFCRWNTFRQNKPANEVYVGGAGTARAASPHGNFGDHGYAESLDRQFWKFPFAAGFKWDSTYLEAICEDAITYVGNDGITRHLGFFDFPIYGVAAGQQSKANDIHLSGIDVALAFDSDCFFSVSNESGGQNGSISIENTVPTTSINPSETTIGQNWHASAFRYVELNRHRLLNYPGSDTWRPSQRAGPYTYDAFAGSYMLLLDDSGAGMSIANPPNATNGAEITYELFNDSGVSTNTWTFGNKFLLTGAAITNILTGKAIQIHFKWMNYGRDASLPSAANGRWVEQWRTAAFTKWAV